jgi:L-fuculose-phosphate aldolase
MAKHEKEIVACAKAIDAAGLNRGSSGNISVRDGDEMLITPSAVPSADLKPGMIARIPVEGDFRYTGPLKPSSEWRFHRDIYRARPDAQAVIHTHAPWSTVLAIARKPIPAIHYMIAAFGGSDIPLAGYARYGTAELSTAVVAAIKGRNGCLMANHGMVVLGPNLARAEWLAHELEALAHQYAHALMIGGPHILNDAEIAETIAAFATYRPEK